MTATYTAIGTFQGDADWNVEVSVHGFADYATAAAFAQSFRISLFGANLLCNEGSSSKSAAGPLHEVADADVQLHRMTKKCRERVNATHQTYRNRGLDDKAAALDSIEAFEATGEHSLVTTPEDYEIVQLPISKWHLEPGLSKGFGSLAWGVQSCESF